MANFTRKVRQALSPSGLYRLLRKGFEKIPDPRSDDSTFSLPDTLMAGFALYTLKDPSLLAFNQRCDDPHNNNLQTVFDIHRVPSDSQMRAILDPVDPQQLHPLFKDIFRELQRGKILEEFAFLDGHYLLSGDGTTYHSSTKVHCPSCLHKTSRNGEVTYYHQMYSVVLVHPERKAVIPLAPEPIIQQDGSEKNDCERNAARRWLKHFRRDHPHLRVIFTEDALAGNAPHIRDLRAHNMRFLLSAKPGSQGALFQLAEAAADTGSIEHASCCDDKGVLHHFRWLQQVPINDANATELVNFLEYWEVRPDRKVLHFSWVTDLELTRDTVFDTMRAARAHWTIENETFNTLKNQGYHFDHNFGHGKQNLSVVLAQLMMLAFLVDQVQQLCNPLFAAAREKWQTKRAIWERLRSMFQLLPVSSMEHMYECLVYGYTYPQGSAGVPLTAGSSPASPGLDSS